jgi:hypothetical protein
VLSTLQLHIFSHNLSVFSERGLGEKILLGGTTSGSGGLSIRFAGQFQTNIDYSTNTAMPALSALRSIFSFNP